MSAEADPVFEPPVRTDELDPTIRARRVEWDAALQPMNAHWSEHAEARIRSCQDVVDRLAEYHARVVDHTDVDLSAPTRWVAILESTGRCIGLADALIDQIRRGYASETAGTARVLHEALDLAVALAGGDESQARRWLGGKQYSTKRAQAERTAFFARLVADAQALAKIDPEVAERIAMAEQALGMPVDHAAEGIHEDSGRMYGDLSNSVHNRRRGFADSIVLELRRFNYGRHPDPRVRNRWIVIAEDLVHQTCLDVPSALAEIVGVDMVRETALQLAAQIPLARSRYPLS